jgi:NADH dehydrogenase
MDVVVLGGGGTLGRLLCQLLATRGHHPIAIGRATGDLRDPATIARPGARVIINCAGASVAMGPRRGWRGYRAVDIPIGIAAAQAARQVGARLVYVGVHHPPALRRTAYVDAHEQVAAAMHDIDACIVRATGFFSAYTALLPIARRGLLVDIGDGRARTNPICERDLAEIVVDIALGGDGPRDVSAGGPDVLTRREIFELVAAQADRRVRVAGLPVWAATVGAAVTRVVHPRMGQFMQFAVGLARYDVIAPSLGTTRFVDYVRSGGGRVPSQLSHARPASG